MAVINKILTASIDDLYLDPLNARLGRSNTRPDLSQEAILELMRDWTLDELAVSFLESGFWVHEALLVVQQELYGETRLIVVEGNRRLAALKYLHAAVVGNPLSSKWKQIASIKGPLPTLFTEIPYMIAESREDIRAFLGFRHVTGIKEWRPAEKAEYIGKMIEERGMTYEEVMQKIGSKTPTVRQNYISYRLLLQMEDHGDIDVEAVEDKFSVLYLSLRTEGVQTYLQIDIRADPQAAQRPVPEDKLQHLASFALWLFGDRTRPPLFTDSRLVDRFGTILESEEAVSYLERTRNPSFDVAFSLAGGDEPELVRSIEQAADSIELALTRVHRYKDSAKVQKAVRTLAQDAYQLLSIFPQIRDSVAQETH